MAGDVICKHDNEDVCVRNLASAVLLGTVVVLTLTSCTSQEEHLRATRFGFRELGLPMQLKTAQLRLETDGLQRRKNATRIAVDTYLVEQGRDAVQVMNRFEDIWS